MYVFYLYMPGKAHFSAVGLVGMLGNQALRPRSLTGSGRWSSPALNCQWRFSFGTRTPKGVLSLV